MGTTPKLVRAGNDTGGDGRLPAGPSERPIRLAGEAMWSLARSDPAVYRMLADDIEQQAGTLSLVATAGLTPPSVLACSGSTLGNLSAEGYPGRRQHPAGGAADEIERLAARRAMTAFSARHANVQPNSGSAANLSVYFGLLEPGDTILAPDPSCGGHHSHGSPASVAGKYGTAVSYGLDRLGRLDYRQVRALARRSLPKLIVCVAGAVPRTPDFARLRSIADEVGALLLADISQVAGLVAAGVHPNPIDHAHVTTSSTSGQLGGPRGGLILLGKDAGMPLADGHTSLWRRLESAVYPLAQGSANAGAIAGKAHALGLTAGPGFRRTARETVTNARALAAHLLDLGRDVVTYGTENHLILLDVMSAGMTGAVAEQALAACGILAGKSRLPFDVKPPPVGSAIRLGTNLLTLRGMGPRDMRTCAALIDTVLGAVEPRSDTEYAFPPAVLSRMSRGVTALCHEFPLPAYPSDRPGADGFAAAS